jgi:hypothetical protein
VFVTSNCPEPVPVLAFAIVAGVDESVTGYVMPVGDGFVKHTDAQLYAAAVTAIAGSVFVPEVSVVELAWTFHPVAGVPERKTTLFVVNVFVWSSPLSVIVPALMGLVVLNVKLNVVASPAGAATRAITTGMSSRRIVLRP